MGEGYTPRGAFNTFNTFDECIFGDLFEFLFSRRFLYELGSIFLEGGVKIYKSFLILHR